MSDVGAAGGKRGLVAFASGLIFAAGLLLAGMSRPAKVTAFLDVTGAWDPSLAFVMVGAIAVAGAAFAWASRRSSPVLDGSFQVPLRSGPIDARLVVGATLFGAGWGLSGLCPGPAVLSIATGETGALAFVASMVAGMLVFTAFERLRARRTPVETPASTVRD